MKTKVTNFVKRLDETFPDMTVASACGKAMDICKDVENTALCATATAICIGKTATDAALLTVGVTKTLVKKSVAAAKTTYESKPVVCVAR